MLTPPVHLRVASSEKNLDMKISILYYRLKKLIFFTEDCFCTWPRFKSEGFWKLGKAYWKLSIRRFWSKGGRGGGGEGKGKSPLS